MNQPDKAPTLEELRERRELTTEIQELRERSRTIQDRLRWIEQRKRELTDQATSLHAEARGDSPAAKSIRTERVELLAEEQELEATLPLLRKKIEDAEQASLQARATDRLQSIKKSLGGSAGEHRNRYRRIMEAHGVLKREFEAANEAYHRYLSLDQEARAIASRFSLPVPELKAVNPPATDQYVGGVRDAIKSLPLADVSERKARERTPLDPSCPGARLIEEAGPTEAEVRERREQEEAERKKRQEEERALEPFRGEMEAIEALPPGVPGSRF